MQTAANPSFQPRRLLSDEAPPPISYPIEAAMRRLAIGRTKLYELIASGELDTYTIGKRRYVSRSAIERFIARLEDAEREARLAGGAQ